MPASLDLSIIIPAYQEAKRLPKTCSLLEEFLKRLPYTTEIIPVIQGNDGSAAMMQQITLSNSSFRPIYDLHGKGKGRAVRQGVEVAQGTIILFIDADLSVPLFSLEQLIEQLIGSPHLDVLIGSRYLPHSRILIPQPFVRRLLSKIFNVTLKITGLTTLSDTQCGCKLFRYHAAKEIFTHTSIEGFGFDVELLLLAKQLGYDVQEAPVIWLNEKNSRFRIFRDGSRTLREIWLLKKKKKTLSAYSKKTSCSR